MTDKLKELVEKWPHEYYDRKGRRHDALIPETSWVHADELCRRCLVEALLAEQAPAGEWDARELELALRTAWREAPEDSPMAHADWNAVAGFVVKWAAGCSSKPAEPRDPAGK